MITEERFNQIVRKYVDYYKDKDIEDLPWDLKFWRYEELVLLKELNLSYTEFLEYLDPDNRSLSKVLGLKLAIELIDKHKQKITRKSIFKGLQSRLEKISVEKEPETEPIPCKTLIKSGKRKGQECGKIECKIHQVKVEEKTE